MLRSERRFGVLAVLALISVTCVALLMANGAGQARAQTPTGTETATTTTTSVPVTNTSTVTTTTATASASASATVSPTNTAVPTATNTAVPTATATTVPPTAPATQPANAPINLTLSGANEVPPVASTGTGNFRATSTSNSLSYTLTAGGTATGITMAHIHAGAPGTNGPIVAFLMTTNTAGQPSVNQSGTITVADLVGPMAGNMAAFMDALHAGNLYVNVHTVANPAGELRAQFPAPPAAPNTGSTVAGQGGSNSSLFYLAAVLSGFGALAFGASSLARRRG